MQKPVFIRFFLFCTVFSATCHLSKLNTLANISELQKRADVPKIQAVHDTVSHPPVALAPPNELLTPQKSSEPDNKKPYTRIPTTKGVVYTSRYCSALKREQFTISCRLLHIAPP
jgi:hypothetical protein